ncbi:hypothetical protein A2856_00810 [Candidatus Uhrbacteria bacterium RIFCSPHIGHO2_01_FULL_63_20]|uniref:Uncharacterized protein n=1 Tax=Candidatus Uhrbacteria bacterium RIFCSPHIGHO2_01_FULL_63_20 TaxID=1802385 RepID=A0A1F7TN97_9BACT|nr:MAG: hypothetical protein A2856_00810 [Candidatus Uhrbacteria bacterium RIFCSPHIGHO2_01_FULL_63_20]
MKAFIMIAIALSLSCVYVEETIKEKDGSTFKTNGTLVGYDALQYRKVKNAEMAIETKTPYASSPYGETVGMGYGYGLNGPTGDPLVDLALGGTVGPQVVSPAPSGTVPATTAKDKEQDQKIGAIEENDKVQDGAIGVIAEDVQTVLPEE